MSKLFKLKKWLTVPEAARHLSIVFGEEVTQADVLRLALDGRLRLSVDFVNHSQARCGKVVRHTEADLQAAIAAGTLPEDLKWSTMPLIDDPDGEPVTMLMSLRLDDDRYLTLGDEVTTIKGVWDLPMVGAEELDIEHEFQNLTGGPAVTLQCLNGAFVEAPDGQVCQLQESYDDNEYQRGSNAHLEKLKQHIAENDVAPKEAEALLGKHKEERKKYLEKRRSRPASEDYYPAGGLPKDAVLVVRTDALREFEDSITDATATAARPMTTKERTTLLTIIAALCDHSAIKFQERGTAGKIAGMTEKIGAAITDDTIRSVLGKIPDALEARTK